MTEQEVARLVVRLNANIKPYERALASAQALTHKAASAMTSSVKAVGRAFSSLSKMNVIGGLIGAGAAGGTLGWAVKLAADAEQAEVAFGVMLGSADKAKAMLASLNQFAESTPFQLPGIIQASKSLLAFGIESAKVEPTLRALGDVAAGIGAPLEEIAEIYGKAKVQGRLFQEDINQLQGRGIPIVSELAKQFGVAESQIRMMTEKGQINFSHIERAFQSLAGEGGKFAGLMEAQSKTIAGRWSTLKDNVAAAARDIGTSISTAIDLQGLLDKTSRFIQFFSRSWSDVLLYTWRSWQLTFTSMWENAKFFFSDQLWPLVKLIPDAFVESFDLILLNAAAFGEALWRAIRGEGWEVHWVGFSEAFLKEVAKIPSMADRPLSEFERRTTQEMEVIAGRMGESWNQAFAASEPVAKVALQVEQQVTEKTGQLPDYLRKVEEGATKAKAAIDAMQPNTAIRGGSAEYYAMLDQSEAMKAANPPKMEASGGYSGIKDIAPLTENMLDQLRIQTDMMAEEARKRDSEFSLIPSAGLTG